jgi:hypothetical protein
MTYYYKVTVGHWGAADTHIEEWVAFEGQNMKKILDAPTVKFTRDNPSKLWGNIMLLPYDTNRSGTVAQDAHAWYAELICSSSPIPPPTGPTP